LTEQITIPVFELVSEKVEIIAAPDVVGGLKGPGPGSPTKKGPSTMFNVYVFSHMYDMCLPLSHFH